MTRMTVEEKVARALLKRKTPLTKARLVSITGLDERHSREVIEKLRRDGFPILSSPRGAGYWLARNEGELKEFQKASTRKCNNELKTNRAMRMDRIEELREEYDG